MRWIASVVFLFILTAFAPAFAACFAKGIPDYDSRGTNLVGHDFRYRDLSGLNLSGLSKDSADFTGANLSGTILTGSVLRYSSFGGANLSGAVLYGALMRESDMAGATLTNAAGNGTGFGDVSAPGAALVCAEFRSSEFDRAVFAGSNFTDASLISSSAIAADFTAANFTRAILAGVNLTRAVLRNANLTNATLTSGTILAYADLTGATWIDGTVCGTGSIGKCARTVTGAPDMVAATIRPQPGMWRAAEGGTGYLFETTAADVLRLVAIGFDGLSAPTWSIAEGRIGAGNVFSADLKHCTGAGTGPASCSHDLGPVTVAFASPVSATILAPGAAPVRISPTAPR
jgi:uncharacterized protein YjbI with pentapeptide repeats